MPCSAAAVFLTKVTGQFQEPCYEFSAGLIVLHSLLQLSESFTIFKKKTKKMLMIDSVVIQRLIKNTEEYFLQVFTITGFQACVTQWSMVRHRGGSIYFPLFFFMYAIPLYYVCVGRLGRRVGFFCLFVCFIFVNKTLTLLQVDTVIHCCKTINLLECVRTSP